MTRDQQTQHIFTKARKALKYIQEESIKQQLQSKGTVTLTFTDIEEVAAIVSIMGTSIEMFAPVTVFEA